MARIQHFEVQHSKGSETAATADDALQIASRYIFVSLKDWFRHKAQLAKHGTVHIVYGFTSVAIVPICNDRR